MAKGDSYKLRKGNTFGSEAYYPSDTSTSGSSRRNSPNYKQPQVVVVHKPSGPNTDDEPTTRGTSFGNVWK